jgi:tetratricopeptide (TPR) repeat protein
MEVREMWKAKAVVSMALASVCWVAPNSGWALDRGQAPAEVQKAITLLEGAEATYDRGQVQAAIDSFSRLMGQDPKDARYPYYLGRAYFPMIDLYESQGDARTAEKVGEEGLAFAAKALELDAAGNPDAYRLLGDFYGRLTGYKGLFNRMRYGGRSFKHHQKALELDPRSVLAVIGDGADKLYAPSGFGGDVPAALAGFTKAAEMAPQAARPQVWLGRAYQKLKRFDEARQSFRKALELEPRSGFARFASERAEKEMVAAN